MKSERDFYRIESTQHPYNGLVSTERYDKKTAEMVREHLKEKYPKWKFEIIPDRRDHW